jgi:O-antigen/teichoic acid export membrane protein
MKTKIIGLYNQIGKEKIIDYSITFGTEFLVMIFSILVFKFIGKFIGDFGFSEFTISKRFIGFIQPIFMIGMGVTLPKFISIEKIEIDRKYIFYSAQLGLLFLFITMLLLHSLFGNFISHIVFGDYVHHKLILSCIFYFFTLSIHVTVYNFFRAIGIYKMSSLLQLINLGVLPFLFLIFSKKVENYFWTLGAVTLLFSATIQYFKIGFLKFDFLKLSEKVQILIKHGIRRTPGDIIFGLFFSIPVFIASNFFGIKEAGFVAFSISLLNIIIALMSPVNIILLPEASKIISSGDTQLIKYLNRKMTIISLAIGILSFIFIVGCGTLILGFFNLENSTTNYFKLIIIFTSVIGFSYFSVIRSLIDASYEKAENGKNILISFTVFIGLFFIFKFTQFTSVNYLLISFSVAINFLSLLTYYSITKYFKTTN